LLIANVVNHAGWSPWVVVVSWIAVIAVATRLVKLRRTSLHGFDPRGANNRWGQTTPGDGMHSGGGSG
jgi:hypothetical protein